MAKDSCWKVKKENFLNWISKCDFNKAILELFIDDDADAEFARLQNYISEMSPNSMVNSYLNQDKESVTLLNTIDTRSINWKEDLREKAIRSVIEDDDKRLERVENAAKSSCLIGRLIFDIIEIAKTKKNRRFFS